MMMIINMVMVIVVTILMFMVINSSSPGAMLTSACIVVSVTGAGALLTIGSIISVGVMFAGRIIIISHVIKSVGDGVPK